MKPRLPEAVMWLVLAATPCAAQEVGTFVTREEYLRALAKKWNLTLSSDMEIAMCQWRSPLASPGGYVDGYDDDGMRAYIRIPVPMRGTRYENVSLYRERFPKVAYLELKKRFEDLIGGRKEHPWEAALVIPPLRAAASPHGPAFEVASVSLDGHTFIAPKISSLPGLPTRVELASFERALAAWQETGRLSASLQQIVPSADSKAPRVVLEAEFPKLPDGGPPVDVCAKGRGHL
jgi:hypothetical protein